MLAPDRPRLRRPTHSRPRRGRAAHARTAPARVSGGGGGGHMLLFLLGTAVSDRRRRDIYIVKEMQKQTEPRRSRQSRSADRRREERRPERRIRPGTACAAASAVGAPCRPRAAWPRTHRRRNATSSRPRASRGRGRLATSRPTRTGAGDIGKTIIEGMLTGGMLGGAPKLGDGVLGRAGAGCGWRPSRCSQFRFDPNGSAAPAAGSADGGRARDDEPDAVGRRRRTSWHRPSRSRFALMRRLEGRRGEGG